MTEFEVGMIVDTTWEAFDDKLVLDKLIEEGHVFAGEWHCHGVKDGIEYIVPESQLILPVTKFNVGDEVIYAENNEKVTP